MVKAQTGLLSGTCLVLRETKTPEAMTCDRARTIRGKMLYISRVHVESKAQNPVYVSVIQDALVSLSKLKERNKNV